MNSKKVYIVESTKHILYGITAEDEDEAIRIFNEQKCHAEKFLRVRDEMSQYAFNREKV